MKRNHSPVTNPAFPILNAYWNDRRERARMDAETIHNRAIAHANFDAGMAALNAKQAERWECEQ